MFVSWFAPRYGRQPNPLRSLLAVLCLAPLLSACRLEFIVQGEGFLLATSSGAIYRQGTAIDFKAAYSETFRAVPHPGYSFAGWGGLCGARLADCPIVITPELLEFDIVGTLEPSFVPYNGPLRLVRSSACSSPTPATGIFTIPLDSLDIDGVASKDAALQVYLTTPDLSFWLFGEETPDGFVFNLPDSLLTYQDLRIVVSAIDGNGVLASVAQAF